MTTTTPERDRRARPSQSEEARRTLTEIAENATGNLQLELTKDEAATLDRSRQDFAAGRTLSFDEMRAATDAFLARP